MENKQYKLDKLEQWHPHLDFSTSVYTKATEKITVICPTHGEFSKRYSDFKELSGCPSCGKEKIKIKSFFIRLFHPITNPVVIMALAKYNPLICIILFNTILLPPFSS